MLEGIISIGDKIEVKQLDSSDRVLRNTKGYISQLLDFVEEDVIKIAMPLELGKIIFLDIGNVYLLNFYTRNGLYQCKCQVINRNYDKNVYAAIVKLKSELEKTQRRQYYRLECIIDIEYRVISLEERMLENKLFRQEYINSAEKAEFMNRLDQMNQGWNKASITDISGGGAKFTSDFIHPKGERLRIKMSLSGSGEVKKLVVSAEVKLSIGIENRYGRYENRVEFVDIGKKDREDIIKFIFEQERHRRRNEKV